MKEFDMHEATKEMDSVLSALAIIIQRSLKQPDADLEIKPEMSLIKDFDLDSLRMVDIVLDIEDHFKIRIMEAEIQSAFTVGDLATLIAHKLSGQ
jgi:acyl carrier protein